MKKKVMSALGWLAGATYLGQILNWCITLLVIRLLTPADYGLMAMTMMFVGFLAVVHEIGLGDRRPAAARRGTDDRQQCGHSEQQCACGMRAAHGGS